MKGDLIQSAIANMESRETRKAFEREVVERLVDARLDGELRIRAPWLSKADRAQIIEATR